MTNRRATHHEQKPCRYTGRPGISPVVAGLLAAGALRRGDRILDVGCGISFDPMVLALAGARKVVGIDRNDTGEIETAARRAVGFGFRMRDDPRGIRLDLEFVIGDAVCLDKKFTRGLFTVVVSTLLWNNLERGKQLHAQQLWRVLTPGGKLILESREPGVDPLDIFEARTKFPTLHRFFKFGPIVASHIPQWAVRRTATGRRRAGWAEVLVGVGVRRSRPLPRIHRG